MKNNIQKQQGTILIVSLVLLTILTLAGVSNMRSSMLDLKILANSRASFNSFQAASSAISQAMGEGDASFNYALVPGKELKYEYVTGKDSNGNDISISVKVKITKGKEASGGGTALGQAKYGQSLGRSRSASFMYRQILVTASDSSGNSRSVQVQGIRKRL
jgi:hypothetical protein